jgi:hypothetical protein
MAEVFITLITMPLSSGCIARTRQTCCIIVILYSLLFNPALANKLTILDIQHRKVVEQTWQGKGFLYFGSVTSHGITYVIKYLCKTFDYDFRQEIAKRGLRPEFSLMSRCPGLGSGFIAKHEMRESIKEFKNVILLNDNSFKSCLYERQSLAPFKPLS